MSDEPVRASWLRSPTTWAIASGVGLVVSLVLPPQAPDLAFWGAVAVSCASAAAWVVLAQPRGG